MKGCRILLKNQDLIAVDKEAGVAVHNEEGPSINLLQYLEAEFQGEKFFPVHRLDKETSGVQILARSSNAAKTMAAEFQTRSVNKIYCGIIRGKLKEVSGSWEQPLSDKAEGRRNPAGLAQERVMCSTHFRILKSSPYFTLCEFDLITGRQHQIRKHTALAGHHLVGDSRYGDPKYNTKMASFYKTQRMFLHCSRVNIQGLEILSSMPIVFEKLFLET